MAHRSFSGSFSGHLGLLDVILDQYAAAGTSHVPPNVEILAFLASFRAILAVFWALFRPFGALLDPLSLVVSSPWRQALEFEAIYFLRRKTFSGLVHYFDEPENSFILEM